MDIFDLVKTTGKESFSLIETKAEDGTDSVVLMSGDSNENISEGIIMAFGDMISATLIVNCGAEMADCHISPLRAASVSNKNGEPMKGISFDIIDGVEKLYIAH